MADDLTAERMMLTLVRGAISEMPLLMQAKVGNCAEAIRKIVVEFGEEGKLALALVGAEYAVEANE